MIFLKKLTKKSPRQKSAFINFLFLRNNKQSTMSDKKIRINIWSGPRNISTALMYSFAQRKDTTVYDEPLYAHYLSKSKAVEYHPGSDEILATMENDGNKVVEMMKGDHPTPIVFFKQMTHHLIDIDWSFMKGMVNIILTRNPKEMLPSFAEQISHPNIADVGYAAHLEVMNYFKKIGQEIIVLDGRNVLINPRKVLSELCDKIGIPFDETMLSWEAAARPEDGCWAKYWYKNVHKSTGFAPYKPKTAPFPKHLENLLAECQPFYDQLSAIAIQP